MATIAVRPDIVIERTDQGLPRVADSAADADDYAERAEEGAGGAAYESWPSMAWMEFCRGAENVVCLYDGVW